MALYRPGPLNSGMHTTFVDRKHGKSPVVYPHELLEPVLSETYGVIVYQEQVMEAARVLAGYSMGEADILRRVMGKKKIEEMEEQREIFIKGCEEKSISKNKAEKIFELIEQFAEYGFNKSQEQRYQCKKCSTIFSDSTVSAIYRLQHKSKWYEYIELMFDGNFAGCEELRCVFTIPATFGSSGSAVYNEKGELISILVAAAVNFESVSMGPHVDALHVLVETVEETIDIY